MRPEIEVRKWCTHPKVTLGRLYICQPFFSTSGTTLSSSRPLGHRSSPDHFECVLHSDTSGRASWVGHGRCMWRELGGDVIFRPERQRVHGQREYRRTLPLRDIAGTPVRPQHSRSACALDIESLASITLPTRKSTAFRRASTPLYFLARRVKSNCC